MKYNIKKLLFISVVMISLLACHSGQENKSGGLDTGLKTSVDTAIIPGTPGPSGTAPRPGDTTQAHRDSIKRAGHISDTSGR